ncbi:MAG: aldo/keto reductase [Nocardioidaceae bacterium]
MSGRGERASTSASAGLAPLGLGLAALGRPAYINLGHRDDVRDTREVAALEARAHEVLDAAWEAGLRHVDAARSYGLAERFLGSWLVAHPGRRAEVTVGSKWGYTYVADWQIDAETHEVKDHSVQTFDRQWPETLSELGSKPDLYLIHSVTPDSPALTDGKLLERLAGLAGEGVRVGLSTSGPEQAAVIARALELDRAPFSAVQSTWNVLEPSAGEALAAAAALGWHVALKETVANGRLTARGQVPDTVNAVAASHETSVDAVALAAARAMPVSVVLLGPSTLEQLRSNLAANRVELTTQDFDALNAVSESPTAYWEHRSGLPWT